MISRDLKPGFSQLKRYKNVFDFCVLRGQGHSVSSQKNIQQVHVCFISILACYAIYRNLYLR